MSWLDADWRYRASVTIDNTAGGAGATDWSLVVPPTLSIFWDNVLANGHDIRLTGADGRTALTYQRQTWTHATETAVLEVDNQTIGGGAPIQAWLYWGNAAAADTSGTFTAAGPLSAYIDLGCPQTSFPVITVGQEKPGRETPAAQLAKNTADEIFIWWDCRTILQRRCRKYAGSLAFAEILNATITVNLNNGAAQGAMIDPIETRYIGGRWVKTLIKAGSDDTDYTVRLTVTTTEDTVKEARALLKVRDPNTT